MQVSLEGWYGGLIDPKVLIEWAEQNPPDGPSIVARLAPVGSVPLNELARELLIKFHSDDKVKGALHKNFTSGVFAGPLSGRIEAKINAARQWIDDPEEAVRAWASKLVEGLEKELEETKIWEEERAL